MITVKDIIQGAKIETKVGVIEIVEITIVAEFYMVGTIMNGNKYRTELNDLVAFINENI